MMTDPAPSSAGRSWLIAGGLLSFGAALLHLAIIVGGPGWYRFFGAGEAMARLAERGDPRAAITTIGIAGVLSLWGLYALSGAGLIRRLPLLRTCLVLISAAYLLRAAILIPLVLNPYHLTSFWIWSSAIVAIFGATYAIGTARRWDALGG
jgi:hypothetical protein